MARPTRTAPERPSIDDLPEDLIEADEPPRPAGDPLGEAAGLEEDRPEPGQRRSAR